MNEVEVTRFATLPSDGADSFYPLGRPGHNLSAVQYKSHVLWGTREFEKAMLLCSTASRKTIDLMRNGGYNLWLFLFGAVRIKNRGQFETKSPPNMMLNKGGINESYSVEDIFVLPAGGRKVGIYLLDWDDYENLCLFLFKTPFALAILTQRVDFGSKENLDMLYEAGGFDAEKSPINYVNWISISNNICELGDVVVKTTGSFDDRERSVEIIFDRGQNLDF